VSGTIGYLCAWSLTAWVEPISRTGSVTLNPNSRPNFKADFTQPAWSGSLVLCGLLAFAASAQFTVYEPPSYVTVVYRSRMNS
jgi:hypothetical protein